MLKKKGKGGVGGGGGGLNQVIFRFLVLYFSFFLGRLVSNCKFVLNLFFFKDSVYGGHGSANVAKNLSSFNSFSVVWIVCTKDRGENLIPTNVEQNLGQMYRVCFQIN